MGAQQSSDQRRRRSLQRLAKVELQLVLQFLDPISRLRAVRCNRHLLAAADAEFAWTYGSFQLAVLDNSVDHLARLQSSLLRHSPIALRIGVGGTLSVPAIVSIRRLRELRIDSRFPAADLDALLVHPALQDLRVLRLPNTASDHSIELAAALPQLHSLSLLCASFSALLEPLLTMGGLTALEVRLWYRLTWEHYAIVGRLPQLRSLRATDVSYVALSLAHFLRDSPLLSQLHHLTVANCDAHCKADEYRVLLARLPQLESLRLIQAKGIGALLAELHRAPSLRLLVVDCAPEHPSQADSNYRHCTHPSRAALQSLLRAAPLLRVQLRVGPQLEEWLRSAAEFVRRSTDLSFYGCDPRWPELQWAALQHTARKLRPRVTLLPVGDD
jgi:hypothetical protein